MQQVRHLRRSVPSSSSPSSSRRHCPGRQPRRGCLVRLRPQQVRHLRRSVPSSSSPSSSRCRRPGRQPRRGCLVRLRPQQVRHLRRSGPSCSSPSSVSRRPRRFCPPSPLSVFLAGHILSVSVADSASLANFARHRVVDSAQPVRRLSTSARPLFGLLCPSLPGLCQPTLETHA
jgi:hypothetical protein